MCACVGKSAFELKMIIMKKVKNTKLIPHIVKLNSSFWGAHASLATKGRFMESAGSRETKILMHENNMKMITE